MRTLLSVGLFNFILACVLIDSTALVSIHGIELKGTERRRGRLQYLVVILPHCGLLRVQIRMCLCIFRFRVVEGCRLGSNAAATGAVREFSRETKDKERRRRN